MFSSKREFIAFTRWVWIFSLVGISSFPARADTVSKPIQVFGYGNASYMTVSFSSDGKYMAIPRGQTICLWDLQTKTIVRVLHGHSTDQLIQTEFSADGRYLVSSALSDKVIVWDVQTGKVIRALAIKPNKAFRMLFSPDGKYVLTNQGASSTDNTIQFTETLTGKVHKLEKFYPAIMPQAFTPDSRYLLTSNLEDDSINFTLRLWDTETGKEVRALAEPTDYIGEMVFTSDGQTLLISVFYAERNVMGVWDVETGQAKWIKDLPEEVMVLHPSPQGRYFVSMDWDRKVQFRSIEDGNTVREFTLPLEVVDSLWVTPDEKYLVARGGTPSYMTLLDAQTGEVVYSLEGFTNNFILADFSADFKNVITVEDGGLVRFWDADTTRILHSFRIEDLANYTPTSLAITPDKKYLIAGMFTGEVIRWDLDTGQNMEILYYHGEMVNSLAVSSDSRQVLSSSGDFTATLWSLETDREVVTLVGHDGAVIGVDLSADGNYAVTGSVDRTVKLWDLKTGKEIRTYQNPDKRLPTIYVALSPDGKLIASGHGNALSRVVRIWETATGNLLRELTGFDRNHPGPRLKFTSDSRYLITDDKNAAVIWDPATGEKIREIEGSCMYYGGISSDNCRLLTYGSDYVKLWDLSDLFGSSVSRWSLFEPNQP